MDNNCFKYCEVCSTNICGTDNYAQHLLGRQHLVRAARAGNSSSSSNSNNTGISNNYFCHVCKVSTTGAEPFRQHCESGKHLKRMTLQDASQSPKRQAPDPPNREATSRALSSLPFDTVITPAYSSTSSRNSSLQKCTADDDDYTEKYSRNITIIRHDQKIYDWLPDIL